MPLTIRLTRTGTKKRPRYRVVATDSRNPRDGRYIEILGSYDPTKDAAEATLDLAAVQRWIDKGAQVTPTVKTLMQKQKVEAPSAE
ncbi:MAG: 30S ribosomal protein S16 [Deltaproteobacteria bacterium]|nr:30S ribosomal protein S16 [Deltaproteobacteria bacterium]